MAVFATVQNQKEWEKLLERMSMMNWSRQVGDVELGLRGPALELSPERHHWEKIGQHDDRMPRKEGEV